MGLAARPRRKASRPSPTSRRTRRPAVGTRLAAAQSRGAAQAANAGTFRLGTDRPGTDTSFSRPRHPCAHTSPSSRTQMPVSGRRKWPDLRCPLMAGFDPSTEGLPGPPTETGSPRSIPACAGKPRSCPCRASSPRVHPRVCGKPEAASRGCSAGAVHPRVCGEAAGLSEAPAVGESPSPRVRGSRPRDAGWLPLPAEPTERIRAAGSPRRGPPTEGRCRLRWRARFSIRAHTRRRGSRRGRLPSRSAEMSM